MSCDYSQSTLVALWIYMQQNGVCHNQEKLNKATEMKRGG
jgi:hypothetical protein